MNTHSTIGAVVISRNDGYGGDHPKKLTYCLSSLIAACDQVIYVDWNSPEDVSSIDLIRGWLPKTRKLRHIQITRTLAAELTAGATKDIQLCVEVLARNIGLRRLTTDWRISTNGDIMVLDRESIQSHIIDEMTFHCVARRETDFKGLPFLVDTKEWLRANLLKCPQHGSGSPLGPSDPWSLINCPGDFQMAHKNLWEHPLVRGFEEALLWRGYADSNVQRKAKDAGFNLALVRDIPAFHFMHYPNTGATGGMPNSRWNDPSTSLFEFKGTTNKDTWGFSNRDFPSEVI